ncbi:hypothetical protein HK100_012286 [Physocladia obscura]|uniref:Protein kinase domain-containing protein n=1 Tax=Physocladia obscura TaxID=109957 RepID=A0AAD5T2T2_9FUNG|nr:hypothetical protein HK100_012286 [Physocladia obscura]
MGCCQSEEEIPANFTEEVNLAHFDLICAIGRGAYGKVKLVCHKQSKIQYALKYIDKQQCISQKAVDYIIQERNLLEDIHCPFVCNLRYSFQDDENMFMVMDMKLGGDLRYALTRKGKMKEDAAKFIFAELCLGIIYLHSKKVVHRDLKPENILLDEHGHACLTDFNIATYFKNTKLMHAIAGSLSYMAPEILDKEKKGYDQTIDWWSLGIVLYEMLFGKVLVVIPLKERNLVLLFQRPFRGKTDNELEDLIRKAIFTIPVEPLISEECADIIKRLLIKPYTNRLGSKDTGGDLEITGHAWLKGYDWTQLENLEVTPIYVPDAKKLNVDETIELEELLFSDKQLKAKPRKIEKRSSTKPTESKTPLSPLEKISSKFKLFDFTKLPEQCKVRKRSAAWDEKLSKIQQHSTSRVSLASNISDLYETRSQYVLFEPDAMTIRSAKSVQSSLSSLNSVSDAKNTKHAMPEIPLHFKKNTEYDESVDMAISQASRE